MRRTAEIIVGDSLATLRTLPEQSVQCVVTSPPYWGLRNYGVEGQIGLEATPAEFVARMVEVFAEVRRVLRGDGVLWLNLGDCYATGAGKVGDCPGGGEQGARWRGEIDRPRDDKRGYRGERLANGRSDSRAVLRVKTRALRDGSHAGKHTAIAAMGPMTQPNRMPIPGLKPKDLVGMPWRVALALQEAGWWLRADCIWHKPNPMPESVQDRPTKAHEYVFLLSKSADYFYDAPAVREEVSGNTHERFAKPIAGWASGPGSHAALDHAQPKTTSRKLGGKGIKNNASFDAAMRVMPDVRNLRTVWTIPTQPFAGAHFATFPEALAERCIRAGSRPDDLVLDPFAGAGTTGVVALRLGRRFLGTELNSTYAAMARKRIVADAPLYNRCEVRA